MEIIENYPGLGTPYAIVRRSSQPWEVIEIAGGDRLIGNSGTIVVSGKAVDVEVFGLYQLKGDANERVQKINRRGVRKATRRQ